MSEHDDMADQEVNKVNDPEEEDRARFEKIAHDLMDVEKELEAHGSSIRKLLANVAKHSLGVTILTDRPPPKDEKKV